MADTIPRHWLAKTLAGLFLGLGFAIGCSVVLAHLTGTLPPPIRAQLAMWIVIPIWFVVFASVYFFESGARAWLWLGAANVAIAGLCLLV